MQYRVLYSASSSSSISLEILLKLHFLPKLIEENASYVSIVILGISFIWAATSLYSIWMAILLIYSIGKVILTIDSIDYSIIGSIGLLTILFYWNSQCMC
jgi:hypothetical protein